MLRFGVFVGLFALVAFVLAVDPAEACFKRLRNRHWARTAPSAVLVAAPAAPVEVVPVKPAEPLPLGPVFEVSPEKPTVEIILKPELFAAPASPCPNGVCTPQRSRFRFFRR